MSVDRDNLLRQFCDVTGAAEDRSKFFLEAAQWHLDVALSSFYEDGNNMDIPIREVPMPPLSQEDEAARASYSDMESPPVSPKPTMKKDPKKAKNQANANFATINSLQSDSSSDEEEGQAFYAGGSERSGQQILGPPSKGKKDIVTEMFKSVRARGAVAFEDEPAAGRQEGAAFSGVGYRLGQTNDDHEAVAPPTRGVEEQQVRSVRLRLYREGFTVDDGPMRQYQDPANAEFLGCIRRGEIPPELSSGGAEVRVSLEDRRLENMPRATSKRQAFGGTGHMLGSPTPPTVGATEPVPPVVDQQANTRAAQQAISVDEAQPITTIQFRLADGSRLTGRFNHSHTVADLRQYLTTAVPTSQLQNFVLMTTFPSAELTDLSVTLEQAKVLNSVVVQRVK